MKSLKEAIETGDVTALIELLEDNPKQLLEGKPEYLDSALELALETAISSQPRLLSILLLHLSKANHEILSKYIASEYLNTARNLALAQARDRNNHLLFTILSKCKEIITQEYLESVHELADAQTREGFHSLRNALLQDRILFYPESFSSFSSLLSLARRSLNTQPSAPSNTEEKAKNEGTTASHSPATSSAPSSFSQDQTSLNPQDTHSDTDSQSEPTASELSDDIQEMKTLEKALKIGGKTRLFELLEEKPEHLNSAINLTLEKHDAFFLDALLLKYPEKITLEQVKSAYKAAKEWAYPNTLLNLLTQILSKASKEVASEYLNRTHELARKKATQGNNALLLALFEKMPTPPQHLKDAALEVAKRKGGYLLNHLSRALKLKPESDTDSQSEPAVSELSDDAQEMQTLEKALEVGGVRRLLKLSKEKPEYLDSVRQLVLNKIRTGNLYLLKAFLSEAREIMTPEFLDSVRQFALEGAKKGHRLLMLNLLSVYYTEIRIPKFLDSVHQLALEEAREGYFSLLKTLLSKYKELETPEFLDSVRQLALEEARRGFDFLLETLLSKYKELTTSKFLDSVRQLALEKARENSPYLLWDLLQKGLITESTASSDADTSELSDDTQETTPKFLDSVRQLALEKARQNSPYLLWDLLQKGLITKSTASSDTDASELSDDTPETTPKFLDSVHQLALEEARKGFDSLLKILLSKSEELTTPRFLDSVRQLALEEAGRGVDFLLETLLSEYKELTTSEFLNSARQLALEKARKGFRNLLNILLQKGLIAEPAASSDAEEKAKNESMTESHSLTSPASPSALSQGPLSLNPQDESKAETTASPNTEEEIKKKKEELKDKIVEACKAYPMMKTKPSISYLEYFLNNEAYRNVIDSEHLKVAIREWPDYSVFELLLKASGKEKAKKLIKEEAVQDWIVEREIHRNTDSPHGSGSYPFLNHVLGFFKDSKDKLHMILSLLRKAEAYYPDRRSDGHAEVVEYLENQANLVEKSKNKNPVSSFSSSLFSPSQNQSVSDPDDKEEPHSTKSAASAGHF